VSNCNQLLEIDEQQQQQQQQKPGERARPTNPVTAIQA
jgi:hypothetical protein